MRRVAASLLILVGCNLTHALLAQSGPPSPQATFRAGIDVVRLDVSVLDKGRRPIRGLTAVDVTVLEDGKPQPIVGFSAIDIPEATAPPAAWMRDVGSDVASNQLDTRRVVIIRSLQRANANIYSFDPTGLTVADGIIAARLDRLRVLAEGTGGRAVLATNTPWEHVGPVFQENSSYYLLGIRSPNTAKDGRFRRLTVKVDRPDAEVRTRSGYYAAKTEKPPKRPAAPVTALDKAFGAGLPTGDLPLELSVAPFAMPGRKQVVLAVVVGSRRPVAGQISTEGIDVLTTAFDMDYKERASHRQTVQVTLRPSPTGHTRLEIQSRLTLPPGRYEVRVGAEGPGGAGSVFVAVDAPDFSKGSVSLSRLVLGRVSSAEANATNVLADLMPITPTVRREFTESEPVTAFLRVYQGGRDPLGCVRVYARIVDTATRTVFEDSAALNAETFGTNRAADYRLDLERARLPPGEYLLTIEATRGKSTVRREVRFSRRPDLAIGGGLDDAMRTPAEALAGLNRQ